jgi:hypothetical protein
MTAGGQATTVTFKNTERTKSTSALVVTLTPAPNTALFSIASDTCSAVALGPGKTCAVAVQYGSPALQWTRLRR